MSLGALVPTLYNEALDRAEHHNQLEKRKRDIESAHTGAAHREQLAKQTADRAKADHDRARGQADVARSALAALDAHIRATIPSGDPVRERTRLQHRIEELADRRAAAAIAEQTAAQELHALRADQAAAGATLLAAASRVTETESRLRHALGEAGFCGIDDARAAVLPADECDDIDRSVRQWRDDLVRAQTRMAELAAQAHAEEATADALSGAQNEAEAARKHHADLLEERGQRTRDRADVASKIAKATELREQLAVHERARSIHDQLATDLRTDRFQAHLLDDTFREIVLGASVRLLELSRGRYALDYLDDDFFVVDHDNARERRRCDTLSGGETFLTALALALQLSEQVQRAAGAVRLDSLFIDEGFGTLDADTLVTVSDAIQQLGRDRRMVGVITHVQELTDSLPARIHVTRGPNGSRATVINEL